MELHNPSQNMELHKLIYEAELHNSTSIMEPNSRLMELHLDLWSSIIDFWISINVAA